ncbi:MAG: nucleotidyltransferase family protein [Planctomycetota bacterium]
MIQDSSVDPARPTAAIILSAGCSARMGSPKALLRFGDETALERMVRVLREAGVDQLVLVLNRELASLKPIHSLRGLTRVVNPRPERGQTSSIQTGIQNLCAGAGSFLLCPVDTPLFEPDDVRQLLAAFEKRPAGVRIVVPSYKHRRGHPVLFHRELAAEFLRLPSETPAHAVLRADPDRVLHLVTENEDLVLDLDTDEAYRDALKRRF